MNYAKAILIFVLGSSDFAHADLFLSEYIEGSGNNQAIEIFNSGFDSVTGEWGKIEVLGDYRIRVFANGSTSPAFDLALSSVPAFNHQLQPGQTATIARTGWSLGGRVDYFSNLLNFNGNDAVALCDSGGDPIDIVGRKGTDPGVEWGTGLISTRDNTLARNIDILTGSVPLTVFDPSVEWRGFEQNAHTLGVHDGRITAVPEPSSILTFSLAATFALLRFRNKRSKKNNVLATCVG